jgi:hypothetical protein
MNAHGSADLHVRADKSRFGKAPGTMVAKRVNSLAYNRKCRRNSMGDVVHFLKLGSSTGFDGRKLRSVFADGQLGPNRSPVAGPQVPALNLASGLHLDQHTQRRTGQAPALASCELRKIDGGDTKPLGQGRHAAVGERCGEASEIHGGMHSAQLKPKHNAQLAVMQVAYADEMKISTARHLRRKAKLDLLVAEIGSASELAALVDTPKSHISALQAGKRGVGDKLAAKMESATGKAAGWMDEPFETPQLSQEALAFASLYMTLDEVERKRLRRLYLAARDDAESPEEDVFTSDASEPADEMLGGESQMGDLEPVAPPPAQRRRQQ